MSDQASTAVNRLESLALTVIFMLISTGLLVAMPWATRPGPASAGWWTAPALGPGVALVLLVFANLATLMTQVLDLRRTPPTKAERVEARQKLAAWILPVEYLIYFACYVGLLHIVGYLLSTLTFLTWLLWRQGLRSKGWLLAGVLAAVALTLVFRAGLQIWMPRPWLFEHLNSEAARFAARWL